MANGHGGSRTPANPAPVSGPGAMSRRTDGQPARYASGMPYGDGQDFYDMQTSAPMAETNNVAAGVRQARQSGAAPAPAAMVTPLYSPTERPDEPVTSGAPLGPGPGPAMVSQGRRPSEVLQRLAARDATGEFQALAMILSQRGL
jgi:hypothetical protein